jgi:hypothetical protein
MKDLIIENSHLISEQYHISPGGFNLTPVKTQKNTTKDFKKETQIIEKDYLKNFGKNFSMLSHGNQIVSTGPINISQIMS